MEICKAVVAAGATVNIPDTVAAVPDEFGQLIAHLHDNVEEFPTGKAVISVHCHMTWVGCRQLIGRRASRARQVECTVNGIGERAGNAAMEEVVMALKTRKSFYRGFSMGVDTKRL